MGGPSATVLRGTTGQSTMRIFKTECAVETKAEFAPRHCSPAADHPTHGHRTLSQLHVRFGVICGDDERWGAGADCRPASSHCARGHSAPNSRCVPQPYRGLPVTEPLRATSNATLPTACEATKAACAVMCDPIAIYSVCAPAGATLACSLWLRPISLRTPGPALGRGADPMEARTQPLRSVNQPFAASNKVTETTVREDPLRLAFLQRPANLSHDYEPGQP